MHKSVYNLNEIKKEIYSKSSQNKSAVQIIAVTKTFSMEHITYLINDGHLDFGENKVQEAVDKWSDVKFNSPNLNTNPAFITPLSKVPSP